MARKSFKAGALSAPLPPVLVTVSDGERTNVLTIAWTGILATHPPRTYISVRPSRYSYGILKKNGEFVINLPSADMARTVDYVGIYTGNKVNKLEKCGLETVPSTEVGVPTLAACPIALECRVVEVLPMGTHDVFIADILSVSADDDVIDETGKIRFDRAGLLAYAHGEYYALGEKLGEFGFSTKKPETKKKPAAKRGKSVGAGAQQASGKNGEKLSRAAMEKGKRSGEADGSRGARRGDRGVGGEEEKKPFYLGAPGYKGKRRGRK